MLQGSATRAVAVLLAAALTLTVSLVAVAANDAKYPNWKGQWVPVAVGGSIAFDPSKPAGSGQQAPLTPEYQKILEESVADQANGGFGHDPTAQCLPAGMPRMMSYEAQEYVVTPDVTYILLG